MSSWIFRPAIGLSNIKAKLPEKPFNIKIAGQIDPLINVELNRFAESLRPLLFFL